LQGCHTQACSLDELIDRTKEAIGLCLEFQGETGEPLGPGIIAKILRTCDMPADALLELL
jgi:predicted RNase H-like HicB family nuclease